MRNNVRDEEPPTNGRAPDTVVQAVYFFAVKQGPVALIAVSALAFMAYLYLTAVVPMKDMLRDHIHDSAFYQRQSCISLAVLAGSSADLCNAGDDDRRQK